MASRREYHPNKNPRQLQAHRAPERFVGFGGAVGGGKALALDTPIVTPNGWVTMGEVKSGDTVFDGNGLPTEVLGTSDIMYNHPCFEVGLSDGSTIIADGEHLWETTTLSEREKQHRRTNPYRENRRASRKLRGHGVRPDLAEKNKKKDYQYLFPPEGELRTTLEIRDTLYVRNKGQTNHAVKVAGALQLPEADLPLEPYALGLWLGDGTKEGIGFTTDDVELLDDFKGFGITKWVDKYSYGINGLKPFLKKLNLIKNKHIPSIYLRSSKAQRLSLLQGIMDTDGCVTHHGHCEITLTSQRLIEDVLELIQSLGIKAVVRLGRAGYNGKDCGKKYRIKFVSDKPVFRLKRKAIKQKLGDFRGTHRQRYITSVKQVGSVPVKCIKVYSPSCLYLAGHSMIPTHNTAWLVNEAIQLSYDYPGNVGFLCRHELTSFRMTTFLELEQYLDYDYVEQHSRSEDWIRFSNGSMIFYGGLGDEHLKLQQLKSMNLGWFGIDQAEDTTEKHFQMLASRLRLDLPGIKYKGLLTANPRAGWFKRLFIEQKLDDFVFIPSYPRDNPFLPSDYEEKLREFYPEDVVRQLLEGDWNVDESGNFLLSYPKIRAAVDRDVEEGGQLIMGIDVARYGDDASAAVIRKGDRIIHIERWSKMDLMSTAGRVINLIERFGPDITCIDAIGPGAGVIDRIREQGYSGIEGIQVSVKAKDPSKFMQLRAELYWELMQAFEEETISIPDDASLISDLAGIKFDYNSSGQLQLESKERIRKRGMKSPDVADALALTFTVNKINQQPLWFVALDD